MCIHSFFPSFIQYLSRPTLSQRPGMQPQTEQPCFREKGARHHKGARELFLCFLRREGAGSAHRAPEAQVWLALEAPFCSTFPKFQIPGGAGDRKHGCSKALRPESWWGWGGGWGRALAAPHPCPSQLPLSSEDLSLKRSPVPGGFPCSVPAFISPRHRILPRNCTATVPVPGPAQEALSQAEVYKDA